MLHLRYRAERCGATLARAVLAHDGSAVFARPIDYELALQNEPERKLDASIREAERKEVEQRLLKADEALEAAEQQHTATTAPLHVRLGMLRQATQEAERSRHQLVETCPDEELRERAERRETKAAECEKELAEVLKQLASLEKQMQAVRNTMLEP